MAPCSNVITPKMIRRGQVQIGDKIELENQPVSMTEENPEPAVSVSAETAVAPQIAVETMLTPQGAVEAGAPAPEAAPTPLAIARWILSFGTLFCFAFVKASFKRIFPTGSPPPIRAAIVISLEIFVVIFARMASVLPFLRLIFSHLECPDIIISPPLYSTRARLKGGQG